MQGESVRRSDARTVWGQQLIMLHRILEMCRESRLQVFSSQKKVSMGRDDAVISLTVILSLRTSVSGHRVYLKHNFYLESNAKCPSVASLPARERTRVCVCMCMCMCAHASYFSPEIQIFCFFVYCCLPR